MGTIWELDFYSRPILDERQKKLWELLICESPLDINHPTDSLYRYSEFTSNQQVNSIWLKSAIEKAIADAPEAPQNSLFPSSNEQHDYQSLYRNGHSGGSKSSHLRA